MNSVDNTLAVQVARIEATLAQHAEYVHESLEELKGRTAHIQTVQQDLAQDVAEVNSRVDVMQNESVWIKRAIMAVGAMASPTTLAWLSKFLGI